MLSITMMIATTPGGAPPRRINDYIFKNLYPPCLGKALRPDPVIFGAWPDVHRIGS